MRNIFNPGIDVKIHKDQMEFEYGKNVFGPIPEKRTLNNIRKSLKDPMCDGPDIVYSIAMDVGNEVDKNILKDRMLLFGIVTYAAGTLGKEPVKSQGHIHKRSGHSGWSPPEIYEIWEGEAIIYMQESAENSSGNCYAVYGKTGDIIIVPPNWAHATISANPKSPLTFGALCDREYGFEYDQIRKRQGLAWYPILDRQNTISWNHNSNYKIERLIEKKPRNYEEFNINQKKSLYQQFRNNPKNFQFVSKPFLKEDIWKSFAP